MNIGPRLKGEQCTATSKATGERCRLRVVGGGVCRVHGGAAPQVAAAREARVVALQASASSAPVVVRDPATALYGAAQDADEVVQRLKATIAERGGLDAASLEAFGTWLDRVSRLSKAVIDSGAHKHQVVLAERQGMLLAQAVRQILDGMLAELLAVLGEADAALVRRQWPRWVEAIVPEVLLSVGGQAGRG
ncbi:hypothetical protein ACFV1N_05875 [Streptosporangium canum]|uniref:hypothetical protein n=1 Tax=Streptosporangium canum TaxID=324952 RepID=UPI0036B4B9CB